MKDIIVLDVMNLPIMANANLKAGHSGMKNVIEYVNILDNLYDDTETSSHLPKFGHNFYITSMYYGKNNPQYINSVIQHFIDVNASAVCIIDEYINELTPEAYALASSHSLPIIFIDKGTPYPLIISSIMELKLSYQHAEKNENLILALSNSNLTNSEKLKIINSMNSNFANNIVVLHCVNNINLGDKISFSNQFVAIAENINKNPLSLVTEYKNGFLIIQSYKDSAGISSNKIIEDSIHTIKMYAPQAIIGISDCCFLMDLNQGIFQAYTASNSNSHDNSNLSFYNKLGVTKLLLDIYAHPELNEFYQNTISPLIKYDEKYHSNLLDTITSFIENNMDFVKTGKSLFVHENTVRYRLSKAKSLIPYGNNDLDFYQTIYILYKIRKIKEFK